MEGINICFFIKSERKGISRPNRFAFLDWLDGSPSFFFSGLDRIERGT